MTMMNFNNLKYLISLFKFDFLTTRQRRFIYLLIVLLIIAGLSFVIIEYKETKIGLKNELKNLTETIEIDINSWITDQIDDAQLLVNSQYFKYCLLSYLKYHESTNRKQLTNFLSFYALNNDHSEVLIVDSNNNIIFTLFNTINSLSIQSIESLKHAAQVNRTVISDIQKDEKNAFYYISIITPFHINNNTNPLFVVLITYAHNFSLPILTAGTTSRFDVRKMMIDTSQHAVYIFRNDSNTKTENITIYNLNSNNFKYAIHSQSNFIITNDLNNKKVIAYKKLISNTDWILVTALPYWNVFSSWYKIAWLSVLIIILSFVFILSFVVLINKNNEKYFYQKLYENNQKQLQQYLQYKLMLESIGDGIICTDSNGKIQIFNYIAELLTGYKFDEIKNEHVNKILNIVDKTKIDRQHDIFKSILDGSYSGDYLHSVLISKDGIIVPINYKGTVIKDNEGKVLGAIIVIQDQTKESFLQLLSEIRIRFVNYAIEHTRDEFIHHALKNLADLTDSFAGCFIGYNYYFNKTNDFNQYLLPDFCNIYCADTTTEISIDYNSVWQQCFECKSVIINDSNTSYFSLNNNQNKKDKHELFIPIIDNNNTVAVIGFANITREYTENEKSKIMILADILYEMIVYKEKEETYKNLVTLTNDLVCIIDLHNATFILVNPSFVKILGYSEEELKSKSFVEFIHPEDVEKTLGIMNNTLLAGENIETFENRYRCIDGTYRWLDWNAHPIASMGLAFAIARDVTERKQLEDILRKSEEKFKNLFIHSNDGISLHQLVYDNNGNPVDYIILDVNPKYEEMLSINKNEAIGKRSTEVYKQATPPYFDIYKEVTLTGNPTVFETFYEPAGKYFIISVYSPQKGQFATIFKDITPFKKSEQELQESEKKFSLFMNNLPLVVVIRDIMGHYVFMNDKWEDAMDLKKEDWLGKTPFDVFPEEDAKKLIQIDHDAIVNGTTEPIELTLHHKTGIKHWLANRFVIYNTNNKPVYVATLYIDISEKQKVEEERERLKDQLIQAQKLESIGRLAGGVAHDYNNMLEVIMGNAQLAMMQLENTAELKIFLNEILNASRRSAEITRQLLTFARKQITEPQIVNVNFVIETMLKMLGRLIGENIELIFNPENKIWNILIDPTQINQIIANLCINARDAIDANGIITITTNNVTLDEYYCSQAPDCLPGEYVMISVNDNGCGMDKEIMDKIFDPFFTTKEFGKGTGLGLSTVYGIVKQNNGFIKVYSEKGSGSTFNIYFPRYVTENEYQETEIIDDKPLGNGETVLVVEDEQSLLKMIQIMLERLQYNVIAVSSPLEAIELVKSRGNEIALMLTDLVMPGMNGVELYEAINKINPHIKNIFMSGYTDLVIYEHIVNKESNYLQKPFSMFDLAKKLKHVLTS